VFTGKEGRSYCTTDLETLRPSRVFNFEQNLIHVNPTSSGSTVRKYLTNHLITPLAEKTRGI